MPPTKTVEFTKHALSRLHERGITEEQVAEVIRTPDETQKSFRQRTVAAKAVEGRSLRVVYVPKGEVNLVITVYFLED